MAAVSSPYGLKAVNHLGGTPYAGSTRMYPIASGYAANLYNGSVVSVVAAGTIEFTAAVGTAAAPFQAGTVGVFVGCTYTDPNSGNIVFRQNWPTGTVAADALAYVIDDPAVVFPSASGCNSSSNSFRYMLFYLSTDNKHRVNNKW
jgi:hypothetical protein